MAALVGTRLSFVVAMVAGSVRFSSLNLCKLGRVGRRRGSVVDRSISASILADRRHHFGARLLIGSRPKRGGTVQPRGKAVNFRGAIYRCARAPPATPVGGPK